MLEFPIWIETVYKSALYLNAFISIPAHIFLIFLARFRTPVEMKSYRYTIINTTFWSLLFVIHSSCFYQIMPLFPLPAAKICGVLGYFGDYYGGQIPFMIMIILMFNVIVAAVLCFFNLYICVVYLKAYQHIKLRHGLSIYFLCHILATSCSIYVVHNAYTPSNELREEILRIYPYLYDFLYKQDITIFGFNPVLNTHTLVLINLSRVIVISIWIIVPSCLAHMTYHLHKLQGVPDNRLNFKKRIVQMLLTRASAPMVMGFLPTAFSFIVARIWPEQSFIIGNILLIFAFSHGFFVCVSTILVFRPFKKAAAEIFKKPKNLFKRVQIFVDNAGLANSSKFSVVTNVANGKFQKIAPKRMVSVEKFENIPKF